MFLVLSGFKQLVKLWDDPLLKLSLYGSMEEKHNVVQFSVNLMDFIMMQSAGAAGWISWWLKAELVVGILYNVKSLMYDV